MLIEEAIVPRSQHSLNHSIYSFFHSLIFVVYYVQAYSKTGDRAVNNKNPCLCGTSFISVKRDNKQDNDQY